MFVIYVVSLLALRFFILPILGSVDGGEDAVRKSDYVSELHLVNVFKELNTILNGLSFLLGYRVQRDVEALLYIITFSHTVASQSHDYDSKDQQKSQELMASAQNMPRMIQNMTMFMTHVFCPISTSIISDLYASRPVGAVVQAALTCYQLLKPTNNILITGYDMLYSSKQQLELKVEWFFENYQELFQCNREQEGAKSIVEDVNNLKDMEVSLDNRRFGMQFINSCDSLNIEVLLTRALGYLPRSSSPNLIGVAYRYFRSSVAPYMGSVYDNTNSPIEQHEKMVDTLMEPVRSWTQDIPGAAEFRLDNAGNIRMEAVGLRNDSRKIFEHLNIDIPLGKTTVIAGSNGQGKTTIMNLIAGRIRCGKGRVLICGQDVRTIKIKSLSDHMYFLSLRTDALEGKTIFEGLQLSNPSASHEEVQDMCKNLDVHDAIEALEGGLSYNHVVQTRLLSAGTKSKLLIARAFLSRRPILLIDEAMAHVDTTGRQKFFKTLESVRSGLTTIIVVQQVYMAMRAAHVIYMPKNREIEQGSPDELNTRGKCVTNTAQVDFYAIEGIGGPKVMAEKI
ncbi:bacteriocin cleavage export ABC transporter [Fusarium heterosporum]|uniref:Bacteriocin cleavage export ABC transporter n=1 Tax=Fusarium heterosporum TaxID=42747 RepID=A0A8H5SUS0_FUSHE|nr:bacteriocin cleavage export ABC transporter [Fusarium heterosporum]